MSKYYFRCYSLKDNFWLFQDLELHDPDFPDYLAMIQINQPDKYVVSMKTGAVDREGVDIYEKDFVRYKGTICRVVQEPPGFVLECIDGEQYDFYDPEELEVIGNEFENYELKFAQLIGNVVTALN